MYSLHAGLCFPLAALDPGQLAPISHVIRTGGIRQMRSFPSESQKKRTDVF